MARRKDVMAMAKILSFLPWLALADDDLASEPHFLSRRRLSKILHTSMDDEMTLRHLRRVDHGEGEGEDEDGIRRLGDTPSLEDEAWERIARHGREWARRRPGGGTADVAGDRGRGGRNLRRNVDLEREDGGPAYSPYVACSGTRFQTGYERRRWIARTLEVPMSQLQTVYNAEEESCFIVTSDADAVEAYVQSQMAELELHNETLSTSDDLALGPLFDVLKMPAGTAASVLESDDWAPPPIASAEDLASLRRTVTNELSFENETVEFDVDVRKWTRTFAVDLLPGTALDIEDVEAVASEIIEYVKFMAQVAPGSAPSGLRGSSVADSGNGTSVSRFAIEAPVSTREAFSLTAAFDEGPGTDGSRGKRIFRYGHSVWSSALARGFESPHGCQVMLDTLEISPRIEQDDPNDDAESPIMAGFDVVLHPPSQFMKQAAIDSSAWNKHCALSLLMGLAVHPSVQTLEVARSIELESTEVLSNDAELSLSSPEEHAPDEHSYYQVGSGGLMGRVGAGNPVASDAPDAGPSRVEGTTNPQWITQSGLPDRRPFFDVGLDGSGQVVAVADGGLDRDNCYFRDGSPSDAIFGETGWDASQRKVVHYDDTFGDQTERTNGHGTYVGGIIAGRRSVDGTNEGTGPADGTAPGSKLAFFDMEVGYEGIADPGVERLLKSLYNPGGEDDQKGARVINASWGRSYNGQYTSFCRRYDAELRSKYPDLLLVVSAGNTGRAGVSSIQDPADCKNPLAVGSSLGYGDDLRDDEMGIEYLADYSSIGPAEDGRMKPDIIAPGHFVLAPKAVPEESGECDGESGPPSVKNGMVPGPGIKYTTGTSMASPALAGAAAILRQYFAEGYCNPSNGRCCGVRGCGSRLEAKGALLKAVMMNGARPLAGGVQFVPSGEILEDRPLEEYDNNQGMGRINMLESVPLRGENKMDMFVVNNKYIVNGERVVYRLYGDKSDGCDREMSATLAWYDPPAAVGCMSCVVNDLDLSIKKSDGIIYPNGRSSRDATNTVERVRTPVADGEEVRVIVEAKNFAFYGQSFSLAITGCFEINSKAQGRQNFGVRASSTAQPTSDQSTGKNMRQSATATVQQSPSCTGMLFEFTLDTANDGEQLAWSLIGTVNGGNQAENVLHGPDRSSGYKSNQQYTSSACLKRGTRYRFQLRNKSGNAIQSKYRLSYGGNYIYNSRNSLAGLGRTSTFRFATNGEGRYRALGSNAHAPRARSGGEAEVSTSSFGGMMGDVGLASSAYDSGNDSLMASAREAVSSVNSDSREDAHEEDAEWPIRSIDDIRKTIEDAGYSYDDIDSENAHLVEPSSPDDGTSGDIEVNDDVMEFLVDDSIEYLIGDRDNQFMTASDDVRDEHATSKEGGNRNMGLGEYMDEVDFSKAHTSNASEDAVANEDVRNLEEVSEAEVSEFLSKQGSTNDQITTLSEETSNSEEFQVTWTELDGEEGQDQTEELEYDYFDDSVRPSDSIELMSTDDGLGPKNIEVNDDVLEFISDNADMDVGDGVDDGDGGNFQWSELLPSEDSRDGGGGSPEHGKDDLNFEDEFIDEQITPIGTEDDNSFQVKWLEPSPSTNSKDGGGVMHGVVQDAAGVISEYTDDFIDEQPPTNDSVSYLTKPIATDDGYRPGVGSDGAAENDDENIEMNEEFLQFDDLTDDYYDIIEVSDDVKEFVADDDNELDDTF